MRKNHFSPSMGATWAVAIAFILFWSSGYIAARFTKELFLPFNLLLLRYALTVIFIFGIILRQYGLNFAPHIWHELTFSQIILGVLYHVAYIGCVFYAVRLGLSAGIAAVILATQPLATTLIECALARALPKAHVWIGAGICIVGSAFVAGASAFSDFSFNTLSILVACLGVLSIAVATILHGRTVHSSDFWPALLIQFLTATLAIGLLLSAGAEPINIHLDWYSFAVVLFLVVVTTLGSYVAMNWLIANMSTSTYSLLFYLVPPAVFVMEYMIYGAKVSFGNIIGCMAILIGVYVCLNGLSLTTRQKEESSDDR